MHHHRHESGFRSTALLLGAVAALSGCTVGPDFTSPDPTLPADWSGSRGALSSRPVAVTPASDSADVAAWWTTFNDPLLTSLVDRAFAANLTIAQAEARIRQARAARIVAASGLYPDINATASGTRARSPGEIRATTNNLFRAGFDATWEIDVFGGIRRGVEASEADITSAVYDHRAAMVTLAGEVATTYFDLRGAQRQLDITRQNLDAQQRTLDLTQQRFDAGFISALDVSNARANVTQTEAAIPSFDAQVQTSIYALSVLLALQPDALLAELTPQTPLPSVPGAIPIGLPSELLQRRPDIKKADADLHAATARIGVAVADQYPKFSLTGAFGFQNGQVASLGSLANHYWSIGPAVTVPVFTGGRIRATIEQARALADEALLVYRQSVLTALQDVETSLVNFTREQQRRDALTDSVAAYQKSVDLSLQLYSAGSIDFLNVLTAQRQLFATQTLLSQSETTVATDLVALYKSLGGGWNPE